MGAITLKKKNVCSVTNSKTGSPASHYLSMCFLGVFTSVFEKSTFIQQVCSDRSSNLTDTRFGSSWIDCSMLSPTGTYSCSTVGLKESFCNWPTASKSCVVKGQKVRNSLCLVNIWNSIHNRTWHIFCKGIIVLHSLLHLTNDKFTVAEFIFPFKRAVFVRFVFPDLTSNSACLWMSSVLCRLRINSASFATRTRWSFMVWLSSLGRRTDAIMHTCIRTNDVSLNMCGYHFTSIQDENVTQMFSNIIQILSFGVFKTSGRLCETLWPEGRTAV